MSRTMRVLIGLSLILGLLLPVSVASGAKGGPTPPPPTLIPPWTVPSAAELAEHDCNLGTDSNGSETLICTPDSPSGSFFTATLVIFAHGYVNPYFPAKKLPWDQLIFSSESGPIVAYDMVTSQGLYFAATSYRANGLVVQDALQDLQLVRDKALQVIGWRLLGVNVIVVGASEGGLITTLSIERYPSKYAGGLSMCGPIGDFKKQIQYWGDFRALYDVYYPNSFSAYGGDAITIPNTLITDWYSKSGSTSGVLANALSTSTSPANLSRTIDLLKSANAPYRANFSWNIDPAAVTPEELANLNYTLSGLLDYNIYATNNGKSVLGGNPYDNRATNYLPSYYYPNLDSLVKSYSANKAALTNLAKYQTTGVLSRPLVVLQNSGDPIVPAWHAELYRAKVPASNTRFSMQMVSRYGHCNFTQAEIQGAFDTLAGYLTNANLAAAKEKLSPEQQEEFKQVLRSEGKLKE